MRNLPKSNQPGKGRAGFQSRLTPKSILLTRPQMATFRGTDPEDSSIRIKRTSPGSGSIMGGGHVLLSRLPSVSRIPSFYSTSKNLKEDKRECVLERGRGWSEKRDIGAGGVTQYLHTRLRLWGCERNGVIPQLGALYLHLSFVNIQWRLPPFWVGVGVGVGGQPWSFQVYNVWHSHKAYAPFYDGHILFFL